MFLFNYLILCKLGKKTFTAYFYTCALKTLRNKKNEMF